MSKQYAMESEEMRTEAPAATVKWNIKRFGSKPYSTLIMCLIAALICTLYAGFLSRSSLPPAEGWYSHYAYLMNEEGAVPYVDFELLFPPLYVYLIAGFTKLFGYSIAAIRVLGVVLYAATGVFSCLIFEKLTKKTWLGLLGGVLTVAVLQSEIVQIFYDYIRVMDLFVFASVYFFLCCLERVRFDEADKPKWDVFALLGSVCAVLASLCKQSSGLIFLLFCVAFFLFLLIVLPKRREMAVHLATLLGTTAVMYGIMAACLASKGALKAYLYYNFVSSIDAKGGGSMLSLLFGWLPNLGPLVIVALIAGLAALVGCFALFRWLSDKYPMGEEELHPTFAKVLRWGIPCVLLVLTVLPFLFARYAGWIAKWTGSGVMYFAFLFGTLYFALTCFRLIFRKWTKIKDMRRQCKYIFLSGVIFVLGFSVSMSGGLVESQTALAYTFLFVVLMDEASYRKREITVGLLCLVMISQVGAAFGRKVNNLYAWWGLQTGSYSEQTTTCDVPLLEGIQMTEEYAQMYNNVYYGVRDNTEPGDEIFVFPHMPVLYLATERPAATFTAVQWFDVSTDAAVRADIETLREKKPKVMVLCTVPDSVIEAHEERFRLGETSGLHEMQDFLYEFVLDEGYECLSMDEVSTDYVVSVWVLK